MQTENFDITTAKGLTETEAARLLKDVGYNELPSAKARSAWAIAFEVFKEPMFLLLVAGGAVYFLLGDLQEALVLMLSVLVVMGITFYQERKTERALDALRDLSSPRALVIRDGVEKRIAGRDVEEYPNRVQASLSRRLWKHISGTLKHEYRTGGISGSRHLTQAGLESRISEDLDLYTRYRMEGAVSGERGQAIVGLKNRFRLSEALSLSGP